jgi:inner membrane protein involved in colicin E2 resistance
MIKRIAAIVFIFVCTAVAWMILGTSVGVRSRMQDEKLKRVVGQIWGAPQRQQAPEVYFKTTREVEVKTASDGKTTTETKTETTTHRLDLQASRIEVNLGLEYRRKGLLWYSTYCVGFSGAYDVLNDTGEAREIRVAFAFPNKQAVYDDFKVTVDGREVRDLRLNEGRVVQKVRLEPGQRVEVAFSYRSQGMDEWWYDFGTSVSQVKDFALKMSTDFDGFDFPQNGISPTTKQRTGKGWELRWAYRNLLSGVQIGIAMPQKLNPGPWVSRVTFSAPVSLFLFFFLLFVITVRTGVKVHPMNFFFLGAAFFSFHLLLAYLADHVSIHAAFLIASAVSIFLVVSYMRVACGTRFALLQVGLSQFVYLVLFSYTFFFEEFTGLSITALCITTLFVVMQYTARVDWEKAFSGKNLDEERAE